jgi:ureidoacrylate peracid hydrolase
MMHDGAHAVTLVDKVRPPAAALVIVDMQNDFLADGGASDVAGKPVARLRSAVPSLIELRARARAAGVPVIYVTSVYGAAGSPELSDAWLEQAARRGDRRYVDLPMCAAGTWGVRVVDGLQPTAEDTTVTKHRFGAFHRTDLDDVLRRRGIRTVIIGGVLTHVCVHATAVEAFSRDYYTVVPADCVADWTDELHRAGLQMIDALYGQVVPSADIRTAWAAADLDPDAGGTSGGTPRATARA